MLPKSDDCNHTIFKTPFQNIIFVDHYYNVVKFAPMKQRSTNWTCHIMPLHDTYCNAVSVSHCFVLKLASMCHTQSIFLAYALQLMLVCITSIASPWLHG